MIYRWTVVDQFGRVLHRVGASNPRDVPKLKRGWRLIEGVHLSDGQFIDDAGNISERPTLDVAAVVSGTAGKEIDIGILPPGTKVYRSGILAGETMGGPLTFTVSRPSRLSVRLAPPFPFMEHVVKIEIDEPVLKQRRAEAELARQRRAAAGIVGLK